MSCSIYHSCKLDIHLILIYMLCSDLSMYIILLLSIPSIGGVKGMKARLKLEMMKNEDELARNKREVEAAAQKRAAQRAVDNGDPYVEEQKRLAEEKKKKDAEEKAAREEARARLKAKAAAFNSP